MKPLLGFILMLIALIASPAQADELRPGYLEFAQQTQQGWLLVWKAPTSGGIASVSEPVLPAGCTMGEPTREPVAQAVITRWPVACDGPPARQSIGLSGFGSSLTDVLVRIIPLDQPVQVMRLTASEPVVMIAAQPDRWQVARAYFILGVEHILFGYDHLLFVLALVLLLQGGWTIAKTVTAFTIAHSLTLAAVTLGFVGLAQRPVEAIIALSILFLAVEIAKRRDGTYRLSERVPWLVAFVFGLLHGFGFAGALAEIGLPDGETPMALLTFNLGVEAGQLAIVFVALAMLALLRRLAEPAYAPALRIAAYGIGCTASYWFIERTLS
jgi:hydrogenase/urease accessory protein HupE